MSNKPKGGVRKERQAGCHCQGERMASSSRKAAKGKPVGTRIGRHAFAAISAVEGIRLTAEMKRRTAEFDRKGLTTDERIRAIVAIHQKD